MKITIKRKKSIHCFGRALGHLRKLIYSIYLLLYTKIKYFQHYNKYIKYFVFFLFKKWRENHVEFRKRIQIVYITAIYR